jgi:uncharacterized protein (PEP-CTERM system associated)
MVNRRCAALLPLAAALCAAFPAQAAWDFTPAAGARLTWSDNIGRQADERAESGMVAQVSPGFLLTNHTPRLDFSLAYTLNLYKYTGDRPQGTQRRSQDLSGALQSRLVDDLLFLEAQADVHQRAASAFGPLGSDNGYLANNRNEVRSYRISPYLTHRFGAFANGQLRYIHDAVSTDNIGFRRSEGNTVNLLLSSGPTFRRFGWDASLARSVIEEQLPQAASNGNTQTTSSKTANLGLRYTASPQLELGMFGGYDDYDFDGLGGSQSGAAYGVNLKWTPSARTSVQASGGHRFYGPSYTLNLQHRSRGTVWSIAYSDAVSSTRSQFLLPQTIDTADMLDKLFRAQISDPVLRAAAVQAYIQTANLPPSLATSVNFFSNRYSLLKQLNASVAWQLARTTTLFSVYKMRREMLSSQQVDSVLLGNSLSTLNDNTDQLGATLSLSYRLGPQTTASLTGNAINARSLSGAQSNHQRDLRLNLARSFGTRVNGTLEVRHSRGSSGLAGQQYTENAVAAALTSKF